MKTYRVRDGFTAHGRFNQWFLAVWTGGVTLRLGERAYCFRPPWNRPLFSERCGYHRFIFRLWGWRLFVRGARK